MSWLGTLMVKNDFSDLVKEVRNQLNLSQEELAHKIGVSFATINRWENGKTSPSKLARNQFDSLCNKYKETGELNFDGVNYGKG